MSKLYFPNLNGLRFIAALLVIVHHVEQFKAVLGFPNYSEAPFIKAIGKLGVILFFVLSGYLITYLLLLEKDKHGKISIRDFYIRRALRIWPLYFMLILLAFFILPQLALFYVGELSDKLHEDFTAKLLLHLFFLPNLALGLFPIIPFASQLWSIGYEEQFYLIWPLLVKWVKNIKLVFFVIILTFIILRITAYFIIDDYLVQHNYQKIVDVFFSMPGIDCMAIGGVFAYLLFEKNHILNFLFKKEVQLVLYTAILLLMLNGVFIPVFNTQVYAVLFGILIVNLSANSHSLLSIENRPMNFLGKISYGLYMYHTIMIVLVLKTMDGLGFHNIIVENVLSLLLTIAASYFSYRYFEEPFIRLKEKFAKV